MSDLPSHGRVCPDGVVPDAPENRLVTAELERAWEERLVGLHQAEEALQRAQRLPEQPTLAPAMREQLTHIARALPALWESGQLTNG